LRWWPAFIKVRFSISRLSFRLVFEWLVWLALAVGAAAAFFLIPWATVWAAFALANKLLVGAALLVCLGSAPLAAGLWSLFIARPSRPSFPTMFAITSLSTMARASLPFLAGDASSVGLLVTRGRLSPAPAVLVITLDQLFTGFGKVAVLCVALAYAPVPPVINRAGMALLVVVAGGTLALLGAAHFGSGLRRFGASLPTWAARPLGWLADISMHLEILRSPLATISALGLTTLRKAIEVAVTLAVQRAVGVHLPLWSAFMLVAAVDLAAVIPGPPSSLGIFEATALFVYRFLGVSPATALVAAILQHAVYLCTDFGWGYAVMTADIARSGKQSLRRLSQAPSNPVVEQQIGENQVQRDDVE
jgi:uncharacterized membrane protein YbhN (UPF0104 family)